MSFLTRVPAGVQTLDDADLAASVAWFPLIGGAIGACVAIVYAIGLEIVPSAIAASIAIAAGVLLTGAFHEDGLADSIDAIGSGAEPERARAILKDPTHGTFGVVALCLSLLIRIVAVASLDGWAAFAALVAAHSAGRATAVWCMRVSPSPGREVDPGLGAAYARAVTSNDVTLALLAGVVLGAATIGPLVVGSAAVCIVAAAVMTRLALRKLGEIGGDVLGAIEQLVEIGVLVLCVAALAQGWISIPWWR
jgi:adenosylcobinamide-GDP ribazoletransferase